MFYFTSLFNYFVTKCQNGIEFLAWKILGLIKDEMVETTEWAKEKQWYTTDKHWEQAIVKLAMYVVQGSIEDHLLECRHDVRHKTQ